MSIECYSKSVYKFTHNCVLFDLRSIIFRLDIVLIILTFELNGITSEFPTRIVCVSVCVIEMTSK